MTTTNLARTTAAEYRRGYSDRMTFGDHGCGEDEHSEAYWNGFAAACAELERYEWAKNPGDLSPSN